MFTGVLLLVLWLLPLVCPHQCLVFSLAVASCSCQWWSRYISRYWMFSPAFMSLFVHIRPLSMKVSSFVAASSRAEQLDTPLKVPLLPFQMCCRFRPLKTTVPTAVWTTCWGSPTTAPPPPPSRAGPPGVRCWASTPQTPWGAPVPAWCVPRSHPAPTHCNKHQRNHNNQPVKMVTGISKWEDSSNRWPNSQNSNFLLLCLISAGFRCRTSTRIEKVKILKPYNERKIHVLLNSERKILQS